MGACAAWMALMQAGRPFSEETGGWYTKMPVKIDADMPESSYFDELKKKLECGEYADFVRCAAVEIMDYSNYMSLTFYQPPHVSAIEPYYMDVQCISANERKKKVKSKKLITYIAIDAQSVSAITNTRQPV
jgi:hypothetical protein